jgi:hypothetical protein
MINLCGKRRDSDVCTTVFLHRNDDLPDRIALSLLITQELNQYAQTWNNCGLFFIHFLRLGGDRIQRLVNSSTDKGDEMLFSCKYIEICSSVLARKWHYNHDDVTVVTQIRKQTRCQ